MQLGVSAVNLILYIMAKGIDINGQLRGKRGGMVYYRANGQQISRARNFSPKNPKSAKQAVQRMILSTAAKIAAAYKPIVNHSFEGVREGELSVRHFRALLMKKMRNVAAVYINGDQTESAAANFALKGAPIVGAVDGMRLSSGSLNPLAYIVGTSVVTLNGTSAIPDQIANVEQYKAALQSLGLQPGDQLTIILQYRNPSAPVAEYEGYTEFAQEVRYARITFKTEPTFTEAVPFIVGTTINPLFIESSEGEWPETGRSSNNISFDTSNVGDLMGAALIRSQKSETGWRYSNAEFKADADTLDANDAIDVYPSYMAGATPINVGDELYLQHAVAAPLS